MTMSSTRWWSVRHWVTTTIRIHMQSHYCTNYMMSFLPECKVVNGKVTMAQRSQWCNAYQSKCAVSCTEWKVVSHRFLHQCEELPQAIYTNCMISALPKCEVVNGKVIMVQYIIKQVCTQRELHRTQRCAFSASVKSSLSRVVPYFSCSVSASVCLFVLPH